MPIAHWDEGVAFKLLFHTFVSKADAQGDKTNLLGRLIEEFKNRIWLPQITHLIIFLVLILQPALRKCFISSAPGSSMMRTIVQHHEATSQTPRRQRGSGKMLDIILCG